MSRIARSVLAAERLARRRQSGGGISGLMALGTITLARAGDQSLVFRAQGADSMRVELLTLTGRVVLVQQAQETELTLGASATQALANGVYLAQVKAIALDGKTTTHMFKLVLMR
ncbi:T9SS type A sorting domain-containing protein [Candidatus Acetothermia bacterium]|nr:T9SS type A sorting domain-containing protein [Candidatus Acetothermia bacterium]